MSLWLYEELQYAAGYSRLYLGIHQQLTPGNVSIKIVLSVKTVKETQVTGLAFTLTKIP